MVDPPDRTMCLYSSDRMSISAAWIVLKTSSAMPEKMRNGYNMIVRASQKLKLRQPPHSNIKIN